MTQPFTINSLGLLIRWCPICEKFHHRKVYLTRRSPEDSVVCAKCGWRWHKLGCPCKKCVEREAKHREERAARKAEADADIHRKAH